ncbi:MAG TPA: bifunctional 3-(3-hydroxy-phenyl)propionate/3-hydroxycinnamic acid hydroxylase [Acetobacteraceae bacterium]|nr:bifunctional 3-(3-hydroxy-phenyl)propionate/3-hydroxycinnamic acid hydroxylase [Acetobacteraceae bacterium]
MQHATAQQATEVAIIGCGPTGAILANLLGLQGISTVVLEREAAVYALPRAVHFDDEVMRLIQTVGLSETVAKQVHVSPGMRFVDDRGRLLLNWHRPADVGAQAWHASYRCHQPLLEQVLRDGFARFPSVSFQTRTEVFALEPRQDAVTVRYEDLASGQLRELRARYVVGCDGARSLARRMIGAPMEDLGFHERWLVVDAILLRPRPDLGDWSVQYCNRARPATYVRGTGHRRRWEIAVLDDEDSASVTEPAKVFELLKPWVGPEDVMLERMAVYTFHSAIALQWRSERLLIAGDAAHLTPPFLGQGMCAGMRDAGNLAWKLARVLRDKSAETLLDSYQAERSPHVREYIELAVRLGGLINTKAMEGALSGAVLSGGEAQQMASIKPRLGPGLAGGWRDQAGQIAPQPKQRDGTLLDDRVGYCFTALLLPDFAAELRADTLARLEREDVAIVVADTTEQEAWLRETGASGVVIRPDRYLLGAARSPAEMDLLAEAV